MKTPWDQWIQESINAGYMVSIFPLRPDLQAKFNETSALEFFGSVEGHPYGFGNFIFGWIDTPNKNFPPPVNEQLIAVVFALFDRLDPADANITYIDGMNLRLKELGYGQCGDMECIVDVLANHNMSFGALLAIPERDSWLYPDGKNMVCDVFVMSMYKAGGVFGDLKNVIQATEQAPRDSYMMKIYDPNWKRPKVCEVDNLPWCQIMGKYVLDLPYWNTIPPYAHMNEKCQSEPTQYQRCPGMAPPNPNCRC